MPSDAIRAALLRRLRISAGITEEDTDELLALPITVKRYAAERPVVSDGQRCTQEQLGEALGITAVRVNRVAEQLREDGIIELHRGRATVLDEAKFQELADFDDRYLHQSPAS